MKPILPQLAGIDAAGVALTPDLETHLQSLGFDTVAAYSAWCQRHGFSIRTDKHWHERARERYFSSQAQILGRQAQGRREARHPRDALRAVFTSRASGTEQVQQHLRLIRDVLATIIDDSVREAFERLVLRAEAGTRLLTINRVLRRYHPGDPRVGTGGLAPNSAHFDNHGSPGTNDTWIDGLAALAHQYQAWIRPLDQWRPGSHNPRRQFASLARHLLVKYPVPAFMDSVWFKGQTEEAVREMALFRLIGSGGSLRTAELPLPMTRKMIHHFLHAPDHCTVEMAVRWGQVRGMGGTVSDARAILSTRLAHQFEHDEFWATVIRAYIAAPLAYGHWAIAPVVDYIHERRFADEEGAVPRGGEFSMKGRTFASLRREMHDWHRELAKPKSRPSVEWLPCGIDEFEWHEATDDMAGRRCWTIRELLSSAELEKEGQVMRHCVVAYARQCETYRSSIWSLAVESANGQSRRMLTIEVEIRSRRIVQVRGKRNRFPDARAAQVVARWAEQQGLHVDRRMLRV